MKEANSALFNNYLKNIDSYLNNCFNNFNGLQKNVVDAMTYSLMAGGKRIRPVLVMEFYKMCGGTDDITSVACSIEMIHTFSLIHDDLPCMDNDDYRRGKLSCHKKYGEAMALLAGDGLNTLPFEVISDEALKGKLSCDKAVEIINVLSKAVGAEGMIGGQVIDLEFEGKAIDIETLMTLDRLKTGALIKAACTMGCILADRKDMIPSAVKYAENIGIAFQIVDDILDVTSTFEKLGKPINSDAEQNKTTFVSIYGLEKSKEAAKKLTDDALAELEKFNNNDFMTELTKTLLIRDN